jgi:hypothetical protein
MGITCTVFSTSTSHHVLILPSRSNFQKLIDNFHIPNWTGYAVNLSLFEMIMGKRTVRPAISEDAGYLYPLQVHLTASLR